MLNEIDLIDLPRLPEESDTEYELILIYAALPLPRKIKDMPTKMSSNIKLCQINYSEDYLYQLASKRKWKDRVNTYDIQKRQQILATQQQHELDKATTFPQKENKTIKLTDLLKQRTLTCLETKNIFKPHELRNIAQTLEIVQKAERLANGQSTENNNTNTTAEITSTQEQTIELTKTETLLDDKFMEKQLEYGFKMMKRLKK